MKIMNTRPLSAISSKMVYILLMLTAMLTACKDDDDKSATMDEDDGVIYVQPEAEPTADAMSVTVDGLTYVFDGGYQGDGKALVARVGNRAASLVLESDKPNEEVENIILHNGNIGKLTDAECAALISHRRTHPRPVAGAGEPAAECDQWIYGGRQHRLGPTHCADAEHGDA